MKHFNDEQKELIQNLSSPSQIDVKDVLGEKVLRLTKSCTIWGACAKMWLTYRSKHVRTHPGVAGLGPSSISFFGYSHILAQERRCLYAAMDRRFSQGGAFLINTFNNHSSDCLVLVRAIS